MELPIYVKMFKNLAFLDELFKQKLKQKKIDANNYSNLPFAEES